MSGYVTTERLYVTADRSELVAEDDPRAAFLLAGAGKELPADVARRYGLIGGGSKEAAPVEDKEAAPVEDKASGLTIERAPRRSKG